MLRLLLGAAIAATLIVPASVDTAAARSHKRHVAPHARVFQNAPVGLRGDYGYGGYGYARPGFAGSPPMAGPPWSGPNQCWEDLGYGRYEKCNW
ncbi:MAG: hypothetical protein JO000_30000 [Alphaproteobacteria bacterium]|nr:hypothetical protein [Alphaproteobacteria bacterium]